jgi:eukaryotic-like serine/threonine-protein kinase
VENTYVGPFFVIKKLGTNRRHRVYHARQTEQNREIALKFISFPSNVAWQTVLEKIDLESAELQKLKHPNLVKVYGAGVHENQIFFATELVVGESLASLLARRGRIAPDLVVEYGKQIAEALHYLHSLDLVHAKLTPEKILITPENLLKLADVRLNRNKRRRWDTSRLRELDIAAYMAPEQFSEAATAKSDLYSLGVMLYEMLTGKLPYDLENIGRMVKLKSSATPPSVASDVIGCPIWLDKLVAQMLDPDPRKRPHSAKAVALGLEEIKKLDTSKKSSAAQVLGSFNALNAGVDKSEAWELLNKKKKKEQNSLTWMQSIPFLLGSLLLVVTLMTYLLWPEGLDKRMDRFEAMVKSDVLEQWITARDGLKQIKDTAIAPDIMRRSSALYDLARRKTLVHRTESGRSPVIQTEYVKEFSRAFQFERDENYLDALEVYQQLARKIGPEEDDYYIVEEAKSRIEDLQGKYKLPESIDEIAKLLTKLGIAETTDEIKFNNGVLGKIIIKFAGDPGFAKTIEQAEEILEINRDKLDDLESRPSPGPKFP